MLDNGDDKPVGSWRGLAQGGGFLFKIGSSGKGSLKR